MWKAIYPPYLQTGFFCSFFFLNSHFQTFTNFVFVFVNPMGAKISKRYFSHNFDQISPKLYDKCDSHGGI